MITVDTKLVCLTLDGFQEHAILRTKQKQLAGRM